MTDTRNDTISVVDRTRPIAAGGAVVAAHYLGRTAVFIRGEEAVVLVTPKGEPRHVTIHGGAILASATDGERIVTGGDDGKVIVVDVRGDSETLATDAKHRWIDHVALGPDGAVAWSAGKTAFVLPHPNLPRSRGREEGRARSTRPRLSADSPFCRRAFGSPSPIIMAPPCGSPTPPERPRKSSNGRARISASQ